jgi:hypothetical protein
LICDSCGNQEAHRLSAGYNGGIYFQCCDQCGDGLQSSVWNPDVWWDGKPYASGILTDESGRAVEFSSKRDKAIKLKILGVSEAGDPVHGMHGYPSVPWREGGKKTRHIWSEGDRIRHRRIIELLRRNNAEQK